MKVRVGEQREESMNIEKDLNMNRHWIGLIKYLRSKDRGWVARRRRRRRRQMMEGKSDLRQMMVGNKSSTTMGLSMLRTWFLTGFF